MGMSKHHKHKHMNRTYGWKKQPIDFRDLKFKLMASNKNYQLVSLPIEANNQEWCSEIEDQETIGSCTGQVWANLLEYNLRKFRAGEKSYSELSRLFIYYNERVLEGTVNEDAGAQLRSGAKCLANLGVCNEIDWPYDITKFAEKPTEQCYINALPNHIHSYYTLTTLHDMKACLANGQCFVFGFMVYDGFESDEVRKTGYMQLPKPGEQLLGGHAVMAVGYNDTTKQVRVRNSWGKTWGDNGYFYMPYEYISNFDLASDFWTVVHSADDE